MSKSKSNKKGKKANKSKTKKIPFRLLDLPTEVIENICELLVEQNSKKSLATLNVANKFLRDVTTPYLWETVRWTMATWNPTVYMTKGMPKMFAHVKCITLVSPEGDTESNGWETLDARFWGPLSVAGLYWRPEATLGQLAHLFFPNLQYVVCLAAPTIKVKRNGRMSASVYVSDRNLIETQDAGAFRKMIFGALRELHGGKNAPRTFADFTDFLAFLANGLAMPTLSQALTKVQTKLSERNISGNVERVMVEFAPFRDLAILITKHASLCLHILTQTTPAAMEDMIKGKAMTLFSLLRKLVAEDALRHDRAPPIRLLLGGDSSFETVPSAPEFFRHLTEWINMFSSHPLAAPKPHETYRSFEMGVDMSEEFLWQQFRDGALALHALITGLYAQFPERVNLNLPDSVVVHGFLDVAHVGDTAIFARMEFRAEGLEHVVLFGRFLVKKGEYIMGTYFEKGAEVHDKERREELGDLFEAVQL